MALMNMFIPSQLQANYQKLQPVDEGYLFQADEISAVYKNWRLAVIVTSVVLLLSSALMLYIFLWTNTGVITPLQRREMPIDMILHEVWALLVLVMLFLVLLLCLGLMLHYYGRKYQKMRILGNSQLLLTPRSCRMGGELQVSLRRHVNKEQGLEQQLEVTAGLSCVEISQSRRSGKVVCLHRIVWESKLQRYKSTDSARAITANFSFSLPRANTLDPISYQSPELFKSKDSKTTIAWVLALWQHCEDYDFASDIMLPVKVQA